MYYYSETDGQISSRSNTRGKVAKEEEHAEEETLDPQTSRFLPLFKFYKF